MSITAVATPGIGLKTALTMITNQFGTGSIMRLGDTGIPKVGAISTGIPALDDALGVGGMPRGRIAEIYGPPSSGKTTLALMIAAQAQKAGGTAVFIDMEHALDLRYAAALGVDIGELLMSQPCTGEDAFDICNTLIRSEAVDVVIVDSVAALVTQDELNGTLGDNHHGAQSRLMSNALRKLAGVVSKSGCCLIFTNQLREKPGLVYGNPEITTGGKALGFYASVRLDVRRVENITQGRDVTGQRVRVRVVKNKVAAPFREAAYNLMFAPPPCI